MKKVGVLTFHRAYNFGAVLQAYALQRSIEKNGYDCQIIDYRNHIIEKWFHNMTLEAKVKNIAWYILYPQIAFGRKKKSRLFDQFMSDNIKLSEVCHCANDFKDKYDAIVVGSDQVWNLSMTDGDINYFLPYNDGADKLSYAASFGSDTVPDAFREVIHKNLASFQSILVRENDGVRLVREIAERQAERAADPTLLLDKEEWKSISNPVMDGKKYILLYLVAPQTNAIEIAKKIAKARECEVVNVNPTRHKEKEVINLLDIGPREFLHLIANAECVVTTSFHGLILSLNHNTPFLFELSNQSQNTNSRLNELNRTFMLEKYHIKSSDIDDYVGVDYDWNSINKTIAKERNESINKLLSSLK